MSFPVAVQSAAFYFLACTPCTQIRHRQKAAQRAKKEREEKARVVAEQPHLYQHPDPFNTNPYWAEEIQIGPSLPKKGRAASSSKNASQRGLTAVSRDGASSVATTSQLFTSPGGRPSTTTSPTNTSRIGSGPTIVAEEDMTNGTLSKTASVSTADDWNLKRYQREDEELWGTWTGHKLMDAIKQAGTTAGRFVESKLGLEREVTEEDRHNFYFSPRNPPVNDYHPPVVSSKPLHKDGLRWMLQPPPPAKVMEGKVPVSRSASMMSAGSRRTTTTMGSLSRQVGEKGLEARLRSGESPFDNELYSTSSLNRTRPRAATKSTTRTRSRRTTRSTSLSTTDEGESSEGPAYRIRRPSYRATATPDIESEDDEDEYVPKSLDIFNKPGAAGANAGHVAQKTRLSTILSSENTARTVNASDENIAPRQTSNLASSPSIQIHDIHYIAVPPDTGALGDDSWPWIRDAAFNVSMVAVMKMAWGSNQR
ncbi:hypothetical protein V8F20_000384 [Naviculisporaceae sp. PSN 640]